MNKFGKGKSVVIFIVTILCMVALGLLAGFGFGEKSTGAAKNIILGLDLKGGVSITYEVVDDEFTKEQLEDTKYKLELRVANYSTESEVYTEGDNRITVDIPGAYDAEKILNELGQPGSIMFVTEAESGYTGDDTYKAYTAKDGTVYKVWIDGNDVEKAQPISGSDSKTGATDYQVELKLNDSGKQKFAEATTENLGKSISIIYDEQIISSPTVESAITTGSAVINNMGSYEEAEKLASTIRIGSLSLQLKEVSSQVVGAKLGNDAISTSLKAALIGLIVVMLFMIIVYRLPGLVASIALAIYTVFELLVLNGFDLTLTLPGIAGIILSIGMAVDANVIIYARIKEELAEGRNVDTSIRTGFGKATSAIIDGNVTTIIASLVLMWKGSGTVKGFAQTLAIGIVLSVFTALVVSRLLMALMYNMGCKKVGFYGVQKERKTIDFLGKKVVWFTISVIAIVASVAAMIIGSATGKGAFNYSIEFKGGTSTTVTFDKEYSIDEFNDNIKPELAKVIGNNDIQGQKVTNSTQYVIKTQVMDTDVRSQFKEVLVSQFNADEEMEETNISSSVSDEMRSNAIVAVILATICMLIYIWFRFKDIKFASSAVLALVHDVIIVIGFYAISRTTVGTTFIACILTIVGYSINATIVIFDRIRENLAIVKNSRSIDLKDIVNRSITQTLTRSIYTSFTTFVMVFVLFIFGVTSIREFALPIMVGIICGGYSSVFITGTLWYVMSKKKYETKKTK
ncbi:MAG: protein translocase subunit SecD [Lachnospiraceae bacterium]|nr:protein translocase subunit SecD [Lachnospiraceae bacterium]